MFDMSLLRRVRESARAVSPVVGVAILVGITVVLGSVVGAFVFNVVNPATDAPDADLRYNQEDLNFSTNFTNSDEVLKVVEIEHVGGEAVDFKRMRVQVTSDNRSVGIDNNQSVYDVQYNGDDRVDDFNTTVPDIDDGRLQTGEEIRVVFYAIPEDQIEDYRVINYSNTSHPASITVEDTDDIDSGLPASPDKSDIQDQGDEFYPRHLEVGDEIELIWQTSGAAEGKRLAVPFEVA